MRGKRYRYFVGGHTHLHMVRTIETLTVLNPGTLARKQHPGVMIADFAQRTVERWMLSPVVARSQTWALPG